MRKRIFLAAAVIAFAAASPVAGKLSEEDRIAHALDRLTFGARPGDIDSVRKMGLKRWIDLD